MALAVAQAIKLRTGGAASVTVNNAWTTTAASLVVCWMGVSDTPTGCSASGSVTGSLTQAATADSGSGWSGAWFYKGNVTGGLEDLTITFNGSTYGVGLFHEVTGAHTTPFVPGEVNLATYTATTNPQTSAITNSVADSIFFAGMMGSCSGGSCTMTVNSTGSSPTGWALKDATNSQEVDGSTYGNNSSPYLIVSSGASTLHGWTTDNVAGVKGLIAFKIAAAGGTAVKDMIGAGFIPAAR